MNEPCPVCGLRFERESGYWTGAMVASYAIGIPVLALIVLAVWVASGWDILVALVVGPSSHSSGGTRAWYGSTSTG